MIADKKYLNVLYWNANGIKNKYFILLDLLIRNHIDIACVCETHLKSKDILNEHPDFDVLRNDRPDDSPKGGVMIAIRKNLKYKELPYLRTHLIENIGIEISTYTGNISIFSCYLPGGARRQEIQAHFSHDISSITHRRQTYFAFGDFNARHRSWNNTRANVAGTILNDLMQRNRFYVIYPSSHTHFPNDPRKQPSTIDIGLTNSVLPVGEPIVEPLSSDHNCVQVTIHLDSDVNFTPSHLRYDFSSADWDKFQQTVDEGLSLFDLNHNNVTTTEQIDGLVDELTTLIQRAKKAAVPLTIPNQYGLCLTPEIQDKIKECKILQRRYQRAQNLQRKVELKTAANRLHKSICNDIDHLRNINWAHKLRDIPLEGNRVKLFSVAKFIKRRGQNIPPLKADGEIYSTPQEKADCLANTFATAHNNPLADDLPEFTAEVEAAVSEILNESTDPSTIPLPPISDTENFIKKLKNRKAPGYDGINNILLKKLPRSGVLFIHLIMISCIKLCYFPSKWKTANVLAIPKPGKPPNCPKSSRPISLLSVLSKILEMHVLKPVQQFLDEHPIIPADQFGFIKGKSSVHQLYRVTKFVKDNLNNGCSTGMMLLDVERAFDRVWHSGLLFKMLQMQFPKHTIKIINSFLSGRYFQVKFRNATSPVHPIPFGVPQGAILSPTLYNVYTSDAPNPSPCHRGLFADDTTFFISSHLRREIVSGLKTTILNYTEFFRKWKISMNVAKTQLIFFTKRRTREVPNRPFKAGPMTIRWNDQVKYLGLTYDKRVTFRPHVEEKVAKVNNVVKLLYPLIARRSSLHLQLKLHIFKTIIRPSFSYGCPLLNGIAACHIKKFQTMQNGILKMILNLPHRTPTREVHQLANIEMVQEYFNELAEKFTRFLPEDLDLF